MKEHYWEQSLSFASRLSNGYVDVVLLKAGAISKKCEASISQLEFVSSDVLLGLPDSLVSYVDFKSLNNYFFVLDLIVAMLQLQGSMDCVVGGGLSGVHSGKVSDLHSILNNAGNFVDLTLDSIRSGRHFSLSEPASVALKSASEIFSHLGSQCMSWRLGWDLSTVRRSLSLITMYTCAIEGISNIKTRDQCSLLKKDIIYASFPSSDIFSPIVKDFKRDKQFFLPVLGGKPHLAPPGIQSFMVQLAQSLLNIGGLLKKLFAEVTVAVRDHSEFSIYDFASDYVEQDQHRELDLFNQYKSDLTSARDLGFFLEKSSATVACAVSRAFGLLSESMLKRTGWIPFETYSFQGPLDVNPSSRIDNHIIQERGPLVQEDSIIEKLEARIAALDKKNAMLEKRLKIASISQNIAADEARIRPATAPAKRGPVTERKSPDVTAIGQPQTGSRTSLGFSVLQAQKDVLEEYIFSESCKFLFEKSDPIMARGLLGESSDGRIHYIDPTITDSFFTRSIINAERSSRVEDISALKTSTTGILKILGDIVRWTEEFCYIVAMDTSKGEVIELGQTSSAQERPRLANSGDAADVLQNALVIRGHIAELTSEVLFSDARY